jgi:hypothetical protein
VADHGDMYHHGALLNGISSMVNLEKLHFHGFENWGSGRPMWLRRCGLCTNFKHWCV